LRRAITALAGNAFCPERVHQGGCRANPGETFENHPNGRGLGFVDNQLAVSDIIAEGYEPTHPHAFFARGRELVADAFADDFSLELCEGEQDIKG
jgi:hypothetical protein